VPGPIVISVPDLGDFRDVEVIEVLVAPGDRVELETPLITLETDKATMDIPATAAGTVLELQLKKGDRVSMGDAVLVLDPGEAAAARVTAQPAAQEKAREASPEARPAGDSRDVGLRVPDLGDFHDVEVIEVLVSVGDTVELETPLITLETDKATMDVPAAAAGRVAAVHVAKGARVNAGDLVATVTTSSVVQAPAGGGEAAAPADVPAQAVPAATVPRLQPRHRLKRPASPRRMRRPPCGALPASSASTSAGCPDRGSRAGSAMTTSRPGSSRP
jgi:pyruvate dehydrogenase E2 component (dihydrolipoamide acetyltransferase)